MASIIANPEVMPAPAPGLLRYGLFSAATVADDLAARGIATGFQLPAEDCGVARPYDANCATHPEKIFDEGLDYMEAEPYWVYATRQCGSVGTTPERMEASVRRRLIAAEQRAVEEQLWGDGTLASSPSLTTALGVTTVVPTALGSGAAIAALEEAFYDAYGYVGTIHINTQGYANLAYSQMLERQGSRLVTPLGSVYSIGAGYGITGPGGVDPASGRVWAFMTPPVVIRRSEIMVPDVLATMDRVQNQYMALAERVYAHTWVCDAVFAVEVPNYGPLVLTVTP